MSTTIEELRAQRETHLNHAKNTLANVKVRGDEFPTEQEHDQLTRDMDAAQKLDKQIKGKALVQSVVSLGTSEDADPYGDGSGLTSKVFSPEAARALVSALKTRGNYRTEVVSSKALTGGALLPPAGQGIVPGLFPNGVVTLSALFRNEPVSGPTTRYYRMDSATAGVVAEGAAKPDAGLTVTPKDAVLVKLATTTEISDELSEDAEQMVGAIALELQGAVAVAENAHIVGALGSASGILTNTATAATLIDVLADEVATATSINGVLPSAVILHPSQLANLRKARATPGGEFFFDPLSAAPASIHGVPLVPTPSTAAGSMWVVASRAATMYRRGPVSVELGTNADGFIRNVRLMRVEERVVLAVQRPSMVSKVTVS